MSLSTFKYYVYASVVSHTAFYYEKFCRKLAILLDFETFAEADGVGVESGEGVHLPDRGSLYMFAQLRVKFSHLSSSLNFGI